MPIQKKDAADGHIREAERAVNDGKDVTVDPLKVLPILEQIKSTESEIAELRGEMSGQWKRLTDAGGIKSVAQVVKKLSKMTESQRQDWLRQFDVMRSAAFGGDTKDMFEDNVVAHPAAGSAEAAE